jgi:hypothetical protein
VPVEKQPLDINASAKKKITDFAGVKFTMVALLRLTGKNFFNPHETQHELHLAGQSVVHSHVGLGLIFLLGYVLDPAYELSAFGVGFVIPCHAAKDLAVGRKPGTSR